MEQRTNEIIKVARTAALASVALAILEAAEGVVVGSVSMVIDGLSHITEAGHAVITILGTWLGAKPADRKHPFGYGRIEYLSELIISTLTIYAGVTGIVGAIESIRHPHAAHFGVLSMIVIAISMIVRIVVGRHDIHTGEHQNSRALVSVGTMELKHSLLSAAALLSGAVSLVAHVSIEPWIALIISADIIKVGIGMLRDMISSILGERMNEDFVVGIKKTILQDPRVHGVYDLVLHNYGPDRHIGSVHIAVSDELSVTELDKLTRKLTGRVKRDHNVLLNGVGIYAENTTDPAIKEARAKIRDIVMQHPHVEQMHGFYMDIEDREISFDVVADFEVVHAVLKGEIEQEMRDAFPDYKTRVSIDTNFGMIR